MSDEATIGHGGTVEIGRGATPDWTKIAKVGDIDMPDAQADDIEVTHQESPGQRKQFIPGFTDTGEFSVPHNYIPGSVTDVMLTEIKSAREMVQIRIKIDADSPAETYVGYCKSYGRSSPVGNKRMSTAVFKLSEMVEAS
ncbi:phage tail tube protein [Palleronia sp. LCG004]|uniref:phage tail tube protein n=1 Tax=Palleronia sp. LCG004 TaxID=3079304 RepID=UPI002942BA6C|nr:phage tail tube protein [Palleronia sp. LCG004]WOI54958.1 phage tail tube protein [Palleronia sp. LCG004]